MEARLGPSHHAPPLSADWVLAGSTDATGEDVRALAACLATPPEAAERDEEAQHRARSAAQQGRCARGRRAPAGRPLVPSVQIYGLRHTRPHGRLARAAAGPWL